MADTETHNLSSSDSSVVLRVDRHLWFEDGNLIIAARASKPDPSAPDDLLYFKIYREMLGLHSPVFRQMFRLPTPVVEEVIDGVQVAQLPDDAYDVQSFLRFIFCPSWEPQGTYPPDYASRMGGALKLSVKYDAENLKEHIFSRLRQAWPRDIREWDRRRWVIDDEVSMKMLEMGKEEEGCPVPPDEDFEPHAVIAMIRESCCQDELRDVLALAYYDLSCYPEGFMELPSGYLIEDDFRRLVTGRAELVNLLTIYVQLSPSEEAKTYCRNEECIDARGRLWSELWGEFAAQPDCFGFLNRSLRRLQSSRFYAAHVCGPCAEKLERHIRENREKVFKWIPDCFII
ncbi:hypothetical protein HGRIS_013581 [Hohenbuehelia grisea]|uniref:BTB domain-containing protein n=1 Tax=Hohenbuehelia grisea TaxID=104357 RepID=A0ABR3IVX3_9AGAR